MEALVRTLVRGLVDHPDDVHVDVKEDDDSILYELSVHPDDVGKVIGKGGRIIKAVRLVVTSASAKSGKRIAVEIAS
ncbi:KH domain-containing protein [Paenibacillus sp.]|uniref:KH domain-containing protein n=1 Tax=Paenibacillus sp. TaxID=58172 RepID=UPI002D5100A4|nr:KH domain-containing protein [Paenibacillus sp.]HZG84426.1 KH domain-containing protein [Paenibacillus sp.]